MKTKIHVSPSLLILLFAIVLSKDFSISKYVVIFVAALIHECGHLIAARFLKIPIRCIKLDIFGAIIETDTLLCSYKKEAALSLAGPVANIFSVAILSIFFPYFDIDFFKIVSLFFAIINLLPAKDFDGGRAVFCLLLSKLNSSMATALIDISSFLCVFILWTISVYFIMRTGSYLSLFVFSAALFSKLFLSHKYQ